MSNNWQNKAEWVNKGESWRKARVTRKEGAENYCLTYDQKDCKTEKFSGIKISVQKLNQKKQTSEKLFDSSLYQ